MKLFLKNVDFLPSHVDLFQRDARICGNMVLERMDGKDTQRTLKITRSVRYLDFLKDLESRNMKLEVSQSSHLFEAFISYSNSGVGDSCNQNKNGGTFGLYIFGFLIESLSANFSIF